MPLPSPKFSEGQAWDGTTPRSRPTIDIFKRADGEIAGRHSSEILALEGLLKDAITTIDILTSLGAANSVLGVKDDQSDLEYKELVEGNGINIAHATGNITITAENELPALGSANFVLGVTANAAALEYKELVEGDGINIAHATGNITITAAIGPSSEIEVTNNQGATINIAQPVYVSSGNNVKLAKADAIATSWIFALVKDTTIETTGLIQADDILEATTGQWDAVTGGSGGLTPGDVYYLSTTTAGQLTTSPGTVGGTFLVRVGIALTTTQMEISISDPIGL